MTPNHPSEIFEDFCIGTVALFVAGVALEIMLLRVNPILTVAGFLGCGGALLIALLAHFSVGCGVYEAFTDWRGRKSRDTAFEGVSDP